jgi:hypothetical protein
MVKHFAVVDVSVREIAVVMSPPTNRPYRVGCDPGWHPDPETDPSKPWYAKLWPFNLFPSFGGSDDIAVKCSTDGTVNPNM